jgi:hypothetical protein
MSDATITAPPWLTDEQRIEWLATAETAVADILTALASEDPVTVAMARLRDPFAPEHIGKLPRITCYDCRQSQTKACARHPKEECHGKHGDSGCGNYMSPQHIHLDYVGHAEVTDRLLTVDPLWDWDFMLRDIEPSMMALVAGALPDAQAVMLRQVIANSPPLFDRAQNGTPIGLWITLTIAGVTRKGYGSVEPGKSDAEKQLIGDALRNAAMRFGVALNLWSKNLLESEALPDDQQAAPHGDPHAHRDQLPPPQARPPADGPAIGNGQAPPWFVELGYADADEARAMDESLRAIYGSVRPPQREPIRAWLIDHGYTTMSEGLVKAVPFPIAKEHSAEYAEVLKHARDLSSQAAVAPGATTADAERAAAAAPAPESPEPVYTSPPGPEGGEDAPAPPPAASLPEPRVPEGTPPEQIERAIAEVEHMKQPEVKDQLRNRGLPVGGAVDAQRKRLATALLAEWATQATSGSVEVGLPASDDQGDAAAADEAPAASAG